MMPSTIADSISYHKPLTVLQIIPRLVSGGAERSCVDIAHALVKQGHKAIIVSEGGRYLDEIHSFGGIHIALPVATKSPWKIYRNISALRKIIREHRVDVVHARSRAPAWSAYYAARAEGIKYMTTYHGLYGESNFLKKAYNQIMVAGDAVICVSDFIAQQIVLRYPQAATKIHVIHRGVNLVHYSPELVTRQRIEQLLKSWGLVDDLRNVILLPGRITTIKGHLILVEAVKELKKWRDDFVCICVGDIQKGKDNYADKLRQAIKSNGLEHNIQLVGGCLDMPAAYAIAHIVTAPSTKPEAFGRVPIESQLMGKPVVASNQGGFCETITDGETGFLFEPNNPLDLAEKLNQALGLSQSKRGMMASIGRKRVTELYNVERMCHDTLNVYYHLMGWNNVPYVQNHSQRFQEPHLIY